MFRKHFIGKNEGAGKHFKLRGREVTRLEGFSDAAFGFAITLLVFSQQVPDTFDALIDTMRGFFSFAICFIILFRVWYVQNLFFRRYDMQDGYTVTLNGILILVVIFYVYPLKFLMSLIVDRFLGGSTTIKMPDGSVKAIIESSQLPALYNYYFAGFATVGLVFGLLYYHAYRNRAELDLDAVEIFETKADILNYVIVVGIGAALDAADDLCADALLLYRDHALHGCAGVCGDDGAESGE